MLQLLGCDTPPHVSVGGQTLTVNPLDALLALYHGSTTSPQHNTCLQQAEGDLGQEYQAVGLKEAPRDPRVDGKAEASSQVLDALGLVVERRLAREDRLEEEPKVRTPIGSATWGLSWFWLPKFG